MANLTLTDRFSKAHQMLEPIEQEHVLHYYEKLDDVSRDRLLDEIEGIDWPEVARLIETHVKQKPQFKLPDNIEPAPWYPYLPAADQRARYGEARELGEKLVREGKVAAFTVAGGQGTRLGWDGPKGTFPATPIRKAPLFQCFAEYIHNIQDRFGCTVPWYVMTSPVNHAPTVKFFKDNDYFGLGHDNVMHFPQAMMPAIDMQTHRVLLSSRDSLALSPNGHGGSLKALWTSGAIADMKKRGIEQISYTQVDNPIVRMVDPLFIGLHALDNAEMSSKMLPKAYPKEKLGNFCIADGNMTVIEYSNLPDELAEQRLDNGELRFKAGSIAIHLIRVDFVESINAEGFRLPFNRAEKKVPYLDIDRNQPVEPSEANAVKLETFVFDALPMTNHSIIYETERLDEFAPIKNAEGIDSPATSATLQQERAARWLTMNGVIVPRDPEGRLDAMMEISQRAAIDPDDLKKHDLPSGIAPQGTLEL